MKVKVELEVTVPETSESPTIDHIKEWIEFQIGYSATLSKDNPLLEEDISVDECFVDGRPW